MAEKKTEKTEKTTEKKTEKKTVKKTAEETAKKTTKKTAEETAKKTTKKTAEETAKKTTKKTAGETAKKTTKKSSKAAKEVVKEAEAVKEEVKEEAPKEEALHPTLQKKKEAREAKAARKAANAIEEKQSRPNNGLLAILIFGMLIGMFVFVAGYNYFKKPATIEKYMEDNGMTEMYKEFDYDEHTKASVVAEGNTIKIDLKIADDAPAEEAELFKGDEGTDTLKDMAAYFLTAYKPQTRALSATTEVNVKKGEESVNTLSMSYSEAKKYVKEAQKKAEEAAAEAEEAEKTEGE